MGLSNYVSQSVELQQQRQMNELIVQIFKKEIQKYEDHYWILLLQKLQTNNKAKLFLYKYKEDLTNLFRQNYSNQISCENSQENIFLKTQNNVQDSYLIMEDQLNRIQASTYTTYPNKIFSQNDQSFFEKCGNHQSMFMQMDIIFKSYFKQQKKFRESAKLFLKWSEIAEKHLENGFLKPIYRRFSRQLIIIIDNERHKNIWQILQTIKKQMNKFIRVMVEIYSKIYKIELLQTYEYGQLFNNENLNNFVMNNLFKYNKKFTFELRQIIKTKLSQKITRFGHKMNEINKKDIQFFQIPQQFLIKKQQQSIDTNENTNSNTVYFQKSVKIFQNIKKAVTPIGKIKVIMQTAKQIKNQIDYYYQSIQKQPPILDPDTIASIIVYIITRVGYTGLLIQIEMIQRFSTDNSLNCVSGYYLSVFKACIQYILQYNSK